MLENASSYKIIDFLLWQCLFESKRTLPLVDLMSLLLIVLKLGRVTNPLILLVIVGSIIISNWSRAFVLFYFILDIFLLIYEMTCSPSLTISTLEDLS